MSLCVYAVRCNFVGDTAREAAWHAWYDGPKAAQMLRLPQFLSLQRFAAAALDTRRKYLALWLVESPGAFTSPEYRAQWGFAEWTAEIADWSRDLYRAPDGIAAALDIGVGEALHLVSFDGRSETDARAAIPRLETRYPDLHWLDAIGLDRHSPVLGLRPVAADLRWPGAGDATGQETVFAPLMPRLGR